MLPRTLLSVLALGLACACASDTLSREEKARQVEIHIDSCSLNLSMGDYDRAQSQALKGLALDGDNFLLKLYLGRALLNKGGIDNIQRAEYTLEQLDDDEDFRVPLSLAEVLERKGLAYREAAEGVASGERYTPAPDPEARAGELRAEAQAALERSLELFDQALDLQPNDTEVLNGLVRVTALLGRYEDSLAWGQAVVNITNSDRLFWRKQLERPNISPQEEGRMWNNVKKLRKLEQAVHLHAAAILNNRFDRPLEAIRELDAILAFDPNVAQVHSQRAQLLVKLERYEEAIASLDNFLRLADLEFEHPDIQRAYRIRADCEKQTRSRSSSSPNAVP
jgi:tetratricopeptide (TPR) repeat protein